MTSVYDAVRAAEAFMAQTDPPRRYPEGTLRQAGDRIHSHDWNRPYDKTHGFRRN
ncbi:TPA: hypothetical protein ACQ39K_004922 [Yersinia enterocolitica]